MGLFPFNPRLCGTKVPRPGTSRPGTKGVPTSQGITTALTTFLAPPLNLPRWTLTSFLSLLLLPLPLPVLHLSRGQQNPRTPTQRLPPQQPMTFFQTLLHFPPPPHPPLLHSENPSASNSCPPLICKPMRHTNPKDFVSGAG